jgi:hypothetical protein
MSVYYLREFRAATDTAKTVAGGNIDGTEGTFRFVCLQAQERSRDGASFAVLRASDNVCVAAVNNGKITNPKGDAAIDIAALPEDAAP